MEAGPDDGGYAAQRSGSIGQRGGDGGMGRSQRVGPPQSATCAGSAAQEAGIPPGAAQNSEASQTQEV